MNTSSNVKGNVSIEAVLIPPKISQKVFGKTIGNTYAAIELTISNRSSDASLIINSIFIDYSRWLLSGYSPTPSGNNCAQVAKAGEAASPESPGNEQQPWQAQTCPNQISSVEYRVVRGQLLDEQPWTYRNWIIRALQATGSVASAFSFTIGSRHAVQAIAAYSGEVVPAVQTFWPDSTIGQMNRISDLAFQVNKVIPKESSDIVVAFFPIDRSLTPGFKRWFIDSPAIFFAPYAMVLDPKRPKDFDKMLSEIVGDDPKKVLREALGKGQLEDLTSGLCRTNAEKRTSESLCQLANVLEAASLNTVRIMVGGTMTVNVDNVPAKIDSIEITTADKKPVLSWTSSTAQELIGMIRGSFLSNGQPVILNADQLGITNATAVAEGSSDKELHFKMSITKPITEKKLTFKVVKKTATGANVESATRDYEIAQTPHITSVECQTSDKKPLVRGTNAPGEVSCVIKGSLLTNGDVKIVNADALGNPSPVPDKSTSTDSELHFKMTISKPVSEDIHVQVTTTSSDGKTLTSNEFVYSIPASAAEEPAAAADKTAAKNSKKAVGGNQRTGGKKSATGGTQPPGQ